MRTRLPEIPNSPENFVAYAVELNRTLEQAFDALSNATTSRINVQSMSLEVVEASANLGRNSVILVDTTDGDVDITLPPPVDEYRSVYVIKKISSDANDVTVAARDSGDVEGVPVYTLTGGTYPHITVISDGYNYWII